MFKKIAKINSQMIVNYFSDATLEKEKLKTTLSSLDFLQTT